MPDGSLPGRNIGSAALPRPPSPSLFVTPPPPNTFFRPTLHHNQITTPRFSETDFENIDFPSSDSQSSSIMPPVTRSASRPRAAVVTPPSRPRPFYAGPVPETPEFGGRGPVAKRRRIDSNGEASRSAGQVAFGDPAPSNTARHATSTSGRFDPHPTEPIRIDDIDTIDLTGGETSIAQTLQKQRAEQVKSQAPHTEKPTTITNLQCVICMDNPTDLTSTSCGHLFCHTCLSEALIVGESRLRTAGQERPKSQCPICRKHIQRTKKNDMVPLLIMRSTK